MRSQSSHFKRRKTLGVGGLGLCLFSPKSVHSASEWLLSACQVSGGIMRNHLSTIGLLVKEGWQIKIKISVSSNKQQGQRKGNNRLKNKTETKRGGRGGSFMYHFITLSLSLCMWSGNLSSAGKVRWGRQNERNHRLIRPFTSHTLAPGS